MRSKIIPVVLWVYLILVINTSMLRYTHNIIYAIGVHFYLYSQRSIATIYVFFFSFCALGKFSTRTEHLKIGKIIRHEI